MRHMTNPRYYTNSGRPIQTTNGVKGHVHLVPDGGNKSLCGLGDLYQIIGGTKVQLMQDVDLPVSCMSCTKALEMVARPLLRDLSAAGLEKVISQIQSLRNGDLKS